MVTEHLSLFKLKFHRLFWYFDHIPLSFECTDIRILLQSLLL